MRVALAAYHAHGGSDYRSAGVSVYTEMLLRHLPSAAPDNEYLAFVGRDAPDLRDIRAIVSPVPTSHPLVRIAWEQIALPIDATFRRAELIHATVNVLPLLRGVPGVVTIHDLSFLRQPETLPKAKATYLATATRISVRSAARVIAVSESTRRDLLELVDVRPERVAVVHSGVGDQFRALTPSETCDFRSRTFGERPYILHVGTLQPRKRIDLLIRAFNKLKTRLAIPHALALVGARGWMYQELFELCSRLGLEEDVRFVGYVHPACLPLWYNCADILAIPSTLEGFGLPVLEAMACGIPVVAAASSSLVEVVGDAGIMVEPGSDEALACGLETVLADTTTRTRLAAMGLKRAAGFTWTATAVRTAAEYEVAMGTA